jgi:hypothetical protein
VVCLPDAVLGQSRKSRSWVLRKYLARSTDEPMMTGNERDEAEVHERAVLLGELVDGAVRERADEVVKLPMTGHGVGPGGRLYTRPDLALSLRMMNPAAIASARKVTTLNGGDSSIDAAALWSLKRRRGGVTRSDL